MASKTQNQFETVTIRLWDETREKINRLRRETGVEKFLRLIDALANGWSVLTYEQQRNAIASSTSAGSGGQSCQIRRYTHAKLEDLRVATGMPFTRQIDAMCEGWHLLDSEQQAKAIASSA